MRFRVEVNRQGRAVHLDGQLVGAAFAKVAAATTDSRLARDRRVDARPVPHAVGANRGRRRGGEIAGVP
jgi:hypothetical protein